MGEMVQIMTQEREFALEVAKAKKLGLPATVSDETRIEKYVSIRAYHGLMLSINSLADYVDSLGKASTSKKGFALQINKRIKAVFGKGVDEMTSEQEFKALARIREAMSIAMAEGQTLGKTRQEIKDKCYSLIVEIHNQYTNKFWN